MLSVCVQRGAVAGNQWTPCYWCPHIIVVVVVVVVVVIIVIVIVVVVVIVV
jgi:hypothetical protein